MASVRAAEVAEILWELKRADKVATYSIIARRAGFSAGTNGRAMNTCLRTVRRDWPHLQWWRAIKDDGLLEKGCEQEAKLRELGFEFAEAEGDDEEIAITALEEHLMDWEENAAAETVEEDQAAPS